ncbi:MAG: hypothetical protein CVT82_00290 [Alphaproteobacteria bacterium HGW-Alphaproteobacteria-4]|nr:MAG: hypothetical protein CVT82_00290 [Alphaproteobacteria bacterium HGW-Alphaproteobacteria-4]
MPQVFAAVGAAVAAFSASAIGTFLTQTIIGRLLVSVALSALAQALAPKPRSPGIKTTATASGGTNPQSFIIGQYATAGFAIAPPMSHGTSGKTPNAYLTYVIDLGDIPGQMLSGLIIDDGYVEIDNTIESVGGSTLFSGLPGWLTFPNWPDPFGLFPHTSEVTYGRPLLGKYHGYAWVTYYDGTQTAADPMLLAQYGTDPDRPWKPDMVGTGLCYAVLTFRYNRELFNGLPRVRFVLAGIPLYDPRADDTVGGSGAQRWSDPATWAPSANPAVQIYNILRGITLPDGSIWGGESAAEDLPTGAWFAAMNECDVPVVLAAGGSEPQYRTGFEVTVEEEPASVIEELLKGCSGQMSEIGGVWKIRVGGPGLPVYVFTDDDAIVTAAQGFEPFPGLDRTWNGIQASYPEPSSLWESKDAPPRFNADYEALDQNRRLVADLSLPAVPYGAQVQRVMRAYIEEERRFRRHSLTLPPDAAILEPLDAVVWTSAANGYEAKVFEVSECVDDLGTGLQQVSLRERDPADYDWTPADELPWEASPGGITLPPAPILPGVTLSTEVRIRNQQPVGVLIIDVAWAGGYVDSAEVQYRPTGDAVWRDVGASGAGRFEVSGIEAVEYDVRVRAVSVLGTNSDWLELLGYPVALPGLPPADVTGFDIAITGAVAHLTWDPVPDEDLSHYIIRWSPSVTGASYSNAVTLVPKVPRPGTSVTTSARTGTYFIRAVDKLGNESLNPAAIVTTIAGVEGLNAVEAVTEEPGFTGAEVRFSEVPGLFAAASGLFSAAGGTVKPTSRSGLGLVLTDYSAPGSGIYEFRTVVDLGARYTSRLTARVEVIRLDDTAGMFAAAPGHFSARQGLFTGDSNAADTEVVVEVSTSDDMVAWSPWRALSVGDFTARGFRFRAVLFTASANVTPFVTGLAVEVDMPDRTIAAADLEAGAGGMVVNFTPALRGLSGLGVSAQGLASGDYYEITGKSAAGFTIQFRNAAGDGVARSFDYVARGYGVAS